MSLNNLTCEYDNEFNEKIICIFRILKILIRSVKKKRLNSINEYLGVEN